MKSWFPAFIPELSIISKFKLFKSLLARVPQSHFTKTKIRTVREPTLSFFFNNTNYFSLSTQCCLDSSLSVNLKMSCIIQPFPAFFRCTTSKSWIYIQLRDGVIGLELNQLLHKYIIGRPAALWISSYTPFCAQSLCQCGCGASVLTLLLDITILFWLEQKLQNPL